MDRLCFARAWVVACLPVKHHQPSLAPSLAPAPARAPTPPPRSRPVLPCFTIGDPASVSSYVERFSLRSWSALESGRFELMDACSFGFGCCGVAAWFPFGFRLVFAWFGLVLLVLACWFLFGSLVVRPSGPVLDGVDGVLDVVCVVCLACLVCLDSLVSWFCLGFVW
jgi:hypothetical protein